MQNSNNVGLNHDSNHSKNRTNISRYKQCFKMRRKDLLKKKKQNSASGIRNCVMFKGMKNRY